MQKRAPPEWSDLKPFLAVMREGTTLGAARVLGVSQTTVSRRIDALEAALGVTLFDRRASGYRPTEAARRLETRALAAEAAFAAFESEAAALERGLAGTVRLTTNELFANEIVGPSLAGFRAACPGIRLEIVTTDRHLDLGAGEADVAIRGVQRLDAAGLVGRRIAADDWSVCCSRTYAAEHGAPTNAADLARHPFIGTERGIFRSPVIDWIEANVPEERVVLRRNSVFGLFAAMRDGIGVSVMSDFFIDRSADLVRCFRLGVPDIEVWLLTHESLRDVPRVRAVLDYFAEYLRTPRPLRHVPAATSPVS